MKTVMKTVACLIAGSILLCLLTAIHINADMLSEDTVVADSETSQTDQQKLYEEIFDPDSMVEIEINISKEQIADMLRDYEYSGKAGAKSTVYRIADSVTFIVNGKKYIIEDVGVRMKGAKSRCNFTMIF